MAYANNRTDNKNCAEHRWPNGGNRAIRSIGSVSHEQCNNCLAVKITWTSDEKINDVWTKVFDEKIIEPDLKVVAS